MVKDYPLLAREQATGWLRWWSKISLVFYWSTIFHGINRLLGRSLIFPSSALILLFLLLNLLFNMRLYILWIGPSIHPSDRAKRKIKREEEWLHIRTWRQIRLIGTPKVGWKTHNKTRSISKKLFPPPDGFFVRERKRSSTMLPMMVMMVWLHSVRLSAPMVNREKVVECCWAFHSRWFGLWDPFPPERR